MPQPRPLVALLAALVPLAVVVLAPGVAAAQGASKTKTSTSVRMPEEGGPLPRATMPEGGVEGPAVDEGGDLPRADMPEGGANLHCHLHEHHGVEHSHCHDHTTSESHDHAHEDGQHCHEHQHDGGPAHEHCHGHEDGRDHAHDHPAGEHCHEHAHDGEPKHSHCHEVDDAEHAHHGTKTDGMDCHEHEGETHCHDEGEKAHAHENVPPGGVQPRPGSLRGVTAGATLSALGVELRWNGYLRTVAEFIENDPRSTFIGRNDGFKLANARLGLLARKGRFYSYVSFDAAVGERESFNDPNQQLGMRLRDAFMLFELSRFADVSAGRFKAPYDISSLESTATRIFIDQSLESRGVLPGTGNEVEGLQQGRQLGVMVAKDRIGLTAGGFDLGYSLALTNGRTLGLALNDNDRPALFGRVSAHYAGYVSLNVGGFTDTRTVGELPDLFDEDVTGTEVSLVAHAFGFDVEAQLLFLSTSFDSDRPTVNSLGLHAQWAYTIWGITFAYRFAWYEPNTEDLDDADQRTEHTVGLSYGVEDLPLRFLLNGTVAGEQQGRKVDNNRLALMAQFLF